MIQPSGSASNVTGNFTPKPNPTVDANGRATMQMIIGGSQALTLAVYLVAAEDSTTNPNAGRALAIDITPVATNAQVLNGQFFWLGNPPFSLTFDNAQFPVNVLALWGVTPGMTPSSSTQVGTFNGMTGQLLFDSNNAGQFNGGSPPQSGPQSGTISTPISVAPDGRAVLSVMVGGTPSTYVLYLDATNDGNMMGATVGGANDTKVSFGFFTGQAPTGKFDNAHVTGTYVAGTFQPVLSGVPNGAGLVTLSPTGQNGTTFSGNFVAGAANGSYSFDQTTGRGIALASSGRVFQNSNVVFYIVGPRLIILMGADQGVNDDAIAFMQP